MGRNSFDITIHDLKLEPHSGHWVLDSTYRDQLFIRYTGKNSRSNILEWLRTYYRDRSVLRIPEPDEPEYDPYNGLLSEAFDLVEHLGRCGLSWEAVGKVLLSYMHGVVCGSLCRDGVYWTK